MTEGNGVISRELMTSSDGEDEFPESFNQDLHWGGVLSHAGCSPSPLSGPCSRQESLTFLTTSLAHLLFFTRNRLHVHLKHTKMSPPQWSDRCITPVIQTFNSKTDPRLTWSTQRLTLFWFRKRPFCEVMQASSTRRLHRWDGGK